MRFEISRASSSIWVNPSAKPHTLAVLEGREWFIYLDTLTELLELAKECGLIIDSDNTLTIYDARVE